MDIVLTHQTALAFWRSPHASAAVRLRRAGTSPLIPQTMTRFDVGAVHRLVSSSDPVHVLVSDRGGRHRRAGVTAHLCGCRLSASALFSIDIPSLGEIGVVSPEVCIGQMARRLSFEEALMLAFELCGTYRRSAVQAGQHGGGPGFVTDYASFPVTSAARLRRASKELPASVFARRAQSILPYVLDGSRSPVESMLAALLTLPTARGGYALPAPELNPRIERKGNPGIELEGSPWRGFEGADAAHPRRGGYFCDLCWLDRKVAVEYDSNQEHTGPNRITRDAIRYNDLRALGFQVLVATWGQLRSIDECDRLAGSIARALGVRVRIRMGDYRCRQLALRRSLGLPAD